MVGGVGTARRSKTMSSLPCLIGLAYRSSPRDWTKRDGSMMPAGLVGDHVSHPMRADVVVSLLEASSDCA